MVNENLIPKTETVYELKNNGIPSYEEFLKNHDYNEAVATSYEGEYQDRLLNGLQYGPGNENSTMMGKKIASVALAVSYFTPLAAVTIPASIGAGVASAGMVVGGMINDDDEAIKAGIHIAEVLVDASNPAGDSHGEGRAFANYIEYHRNR